MKPKDCKGNEIKIGDTITGLYETGNPDGLVVSKSGKLYVKDSDGDFLMLEDVIRNSCVVKK